MQRRHRGAAPQPDRICRRRTGQPRHRIQGRFQADGRLPARDPARGDPRPVVRPGRGDRRERARGDLRRARKPCRLFPAGAGHDPLRRGELHLARHRQAGRHVRDALAARCGGGVLHRALHPRRGHARHEEEGRGARRLLRQPEQARPRGPHRSADRPRVRGAAHDPGAVPPAEEQPAARGRARRRQDRDRRGPGPQDRHGRSARRAGRRDGVRARHGHAAGRHALSRRFRGTPQAGDEGDREPPQGDHVHRRDPHRHRCGRHVRRRHGCLEPAEARAGAGHAALHRLDHLQGIPPVFREGPRSGAALPEDRRQRAVGAGRHRDREGPEALFRGVPPHPLHQRRHQGGGGAVGPLHPRPQAAGQGDRRDRRDRRVADAAAREQAQEDDRREGDRGGHRHDGAHSAQDRLEGRRRGSARAGRDAEARRLRPGCGHRPPDLGDQAGPRGPARSREAHRQLPLRRAHGRRQDRGGAPVGDEPRGRADPLRHVGIHGAPHGRAG